MTLEDLVDKLIEIQNSDDCAPYSGIPISMTDKSGRVLPIVNVELDGNGTVYLDSTKE